MVIFLPLDKNLRITNNNDKKNFVPFKPNLTKTDAIYYNSNSFKKGEFLVIFNEAQLKMTTGGEIQLVYCTERHQVNCVVELCDLRPIIL